MHSVDRTGRRFGLLVCKEKTTLFGVHAYLCSCDCGGTKVVKLVNLRRGHTSSCGCLYVNRQWRPPKTPWNSTVEGRVKNRLWTMYVGAAKRRGLSWELTPNVFEELILSECHYCSSPGRVTVHTHRRVPDSRLVHNGVDRVDSSVGYLPSNCVACCTPCNRAKSDMTMSDFSKWVEDLCNSFSSWKPGV